MCDGRTFTPKAKRHVFIELTKEDNVAGMCGMLNMAVYGTRGAASNFESESTGALENSGFKCGRAVTCILHNEKRDISLIVHGDDFTILAKEKKFSGCANSSKKYEVEMAMKEPLSEKESAIIILNRGVTWNSEGITVEGHQRHPEILVKSRGLNGKSKKVSTPLGKSRCPHDESW